MLEKDTLWLHDELNQDDLDFMMHEMDEEPMCVEDTFASAYLPPLPPLMPVPFSVALSVPVQTRDSCQTAWLKAWTDDQDKWLEEKYGGRPDDKKWKNTLSYWALCATEFKNKFKVERSVKALLKRASLLKLCKSTKQVRQKEATKQVRQEEATKQVRQEEATKQVRQEEATKQVRQEEATKQVRQEAAKQWSLKVEKWIVQNVRKNAHLGKIYLQRVADAIEHVFPNEPKRSPDALRNKIARMRPHLEY
jgi:hypothetical protein